MTQDPIRAMFLAESETKRARKDQHFLQALLAGQAPSATAFVTAVDSGLEGNAALDEARRLDEAAAQFTPPTDTPPAAA